MVTLLKKEKRFSAKELANSWEVGYRTALNVMKSDKIKVIWIGSRMFVTESSKKEYENGNFIH